MSENETVSSSSQTIKRADTGLLVSGWIFSILGGIIGITTASNNAFGKKYDYVSRSKGRAMLITATVLFVIYIFI